MQTQDFTKIKKDTKGWNAFKNDRGYKFFLICETIGTLQRHVLQPNKILGSHSLLLLKRAYSFGQF